MFLSPKNSAFAAACFVCLGNGFVYGYAIFSSEMRRVLGFSASDAVTLGILSQVGLGAFQLVQSQLVAKAHKNGRYTMRQIDSVLNLMCTIEFVVTVLAIGAILYTAGTEEDIAANRSRNLGLMCIFFLIWGKAVGTTQTMSMTIVNHNHQDNQATRRARVAIISTCVGLGGVLFVVVYYLGLSTCSLEITFFGLAVVYLGIMGPVRQRWLKRVRPFPKPALATKTAATETPAPSTSYSPRHSSTPPEVSHTADEQEDDDDDDEVDAIPVGILVPLPEEEQQQQPPLRHASSVADGAPTALPPQQSVFVLLRSTTAWLTFAGTFAGVGVAGCFMSSVGNIGHELARAEFEHQTTFLILLDFLIAQTLSRLFNAVLYAYRDLPYTFACWHVCCVIGVTVFIAVPSTTGAYIAAAFVGASFGGFQSAFPVIAATCFPGHPSVDYAQNIGIALLMSSLGCIVVGEIATAIVRTGSQNSGERIAPGSGLFMSFVFFLVIELVALGLAVVLGRRVTLKRRRAAAKMIAQAATNHDEENPAPVEVPQPATTSNDHATNNPIASQLART